MHLFLLNQFSFQKRKIQNSGRSGTNFPIKSASNDQEWNLHLLRGSDNFIPNLTLTRRKRNQQEQIYENNDPEFIIRISKIEIK